LLWDVVIGFKHERFAENIGFSIYKTDELESIFEKNIHFDVIQLPYSIFDRRFERYFLRLKERGVIILVRSIFLQGLAFLNPDTLDGNLFKARGHLSKLNGLSSDTGIPINALCLDFALLNPKIDRVVIGVDSLEHLRKNIEDLSFVNEVRNIYDKLDVFSIDEEDIILPYRWDKG
jgi:aryl-alcohol dehydrogenase-like predicted oxidoreductase